MNGILDLELERNDAKAKTVRDYFKALLKRLLTEEEGFSGKRPFGNSGWTRDLQVPLIKAGIVKGSLDDDGYIETVDDAAALRKLLDAVNEL